MILKDAASTAQFSDLKMGKTTIVKGLQLFAGLNCFEPGHEHSLHCHADQEKLYVVIEGTAIVRIGEQEETLGPGGVAFAASDVPHSVRNPGPSRLVVMAILSPPPSK
jgi:mannose-6-phosphate isomerase-like protein (cupin superfamily)